MYSFAICVIFHIYPTHCTTSVKEIFTKSLHWIFSLRFTIVDENHKKDGHGSERCREVMQVLATQAYSKTVREVTRIGKSEVEEKRMMYLYSEKLVTAHREFSIDKVLDMSFRKMGAEGGLLYVHTTGGVYSYTVDASPMEFINVFKAQVKR